VKFFYFVLFIPGSKMSVHQLAQASPVDCCVDWFFISMIFSCGIKMVYWLVLLLALAGQSVGA